MSKKWLQLEGILSTDMHVIGRYYVSMDNVHIIHRTDHNKGTSKPSFRLIWLSHVPLNSGLNVITLDVVTEGSVKAIEEYLANETGKQASR